MTKPDYIIIGRDVGQARFHLVGSNYHEASTQPGGKPMDVVHIGELVARMSERVGDDRKATADEVEQIHRSLKVDSVPAGQFSQAQKDAILEKTKVNIVFEERIAGASQSDDINVRYLAVPADGTIKAALDKLEMPVPGKAYEPPLTYPIDKDLMFGYLTDRAVSVIVETAEPGDLATMDWDAIKKLLADRLEDTLTQAAKNVEVNQTAAYHRAVGIYATNMCR